MFQVNILTFTAHVFLHQILIFLKSNSVDPEMGLPCLPTSPILVSVLKKGLHMEKLELNGTDWQGQNYLPLPL